MIANIFTMAVLVTFAPVTIAPMIHAYMLNVKFFNPNANPNPKLNLYPTPN